MSDQLWNRIKKQVFFRMQAETALAQAEEAGTPEQKITKAQKVIYNCDEYKKISKLSDVRLKAHVERARDIAALAQAEILSERIKTHVALKVAAQGALYREVYADTPELQISNAVDVISKYQEYRDIFPMSCSTTSYWSASVDAEVERAWEIIASTEVAWKNYEGIAAWKVAPTR